MNKKNIEEFAVNSRRQLIENLTYEANKIGITKETIQNPDNIAEDMQTFTTSGVTNTIYGKQIEQRQQLIKEIENNGFDQTIEKIAYTWFNRIIAIRFMEINNYLPTKTRVLSSITPGKKEPDIITEALNIDLNYTTEDKKTIYQLKEENNTDELFKLLFIKQCNKLNEILPELFETIDDYTELLFNIQLSNENNIINKLINTIPEENFKNQVETIGWLYQYYNKELKDETYKNIKKQKVGKDRIPAVTQLFTPDWIVKYMVENSLGRLWLENHPNNKLQNKWKYYIEEAQQKPEVEKQLEEIKTTYKNTKLEEIKILDPSMGSGHILVYVFDVLMQLYTSEGYTEKEAVINILENNIYGIDIDDRAYQLAYFAIMMKARSYNKRILNKNIKPNLIAIQETSTITEELIEKIKSKYSETSQELIELIQTFKNGKTLGSITKTDRKMDLINVEKIVTKLLQQAKSDISLINHENEIKTLKQVIKQTIILNQMYDVVITNPPYMGNSNMDKTLKDYLKKEYPNTKQDLFSVFMEKCLDLTKINGFNSMITMQSWMFLSTYEKLRKEIIKNQIINLLHLGANAFEEIKGEVVQTTTYTLRNSNINNFSSNFIRLVNYTSEQEKEQHILDKNVYYQFDVNIIKENPKIPLAYWIEDSIIKSFKGTKFADISTIKKGIVTGNNNKYIKFIWEVNYQKLFNKWIPCVKGGNYRKYYGNIDRVIDWSENAQTFYKNNSSSSIVSEDALFKKGITFSSISSKGTGFRYLPETHLFSNGGNSILNISEDIYNYCLGFLNSKLAFNYLKILNPTLNINLYNIKDLPIIINPDYKGVIETLTIENMNIAKEDWDNLEYSLDFKKHPLLSHNNNIKDNYEKYVEHISYNFKIIEENECKLNQLFNEIYDIHSINPKVNKNDITLKKVDNKTDMESFISYCVGCVFGRFSLDEDGLVFAGGNFDINRYESVKPDEDNIIPILDEEYFDDDIVNQIVNFLKVAFSEETLYENLDFISESLDVPGRTSRDVIRNYMIKKFYSNHVSMYQKCPIYWMFDSGKQNAFKCLIYMHRYEPDLLSRIRFDYLHKTQRAIEENIKRQDNIINNSENKVHIKKATKEKTKLVKQLDEIKLYDQALAHVANQRIELDLDDGVKVNYAKFQNIEVVDPKTNKTKKINLLSKL